MVRSDMQILREEIRRITTEFDEFKDKSAKSEKAMTEKIRQLTLDLMRIRPKNDFSA